MADRLPRLWTKAFYQHVDPDVLSIGFDRAEPGHLSEAIELIETDFYIWYVVAGRGAVHVNRRWHFFGPGDLVTLGPGSVYHQERSDIAEPFRLYHMHLLPFGRQDHGLNQAVSEAWPLKVSAGHRADLITVLEDLLDAFVTRTTDHSLLVKGLTFQLMHVLFELLQGPPPAEPPRAGRSLLAAKELIEREFTRDLSLAEIAEHGGLSASHLSALFSRRLGYSPIAYLLKIRLREAKLRLARGAAVKEAAYASGFHSPQYFSRFFRKKTGLSPSRFAAMYTLEMPRH
jgi:AraC-like DNA-binding protein